VSFNSSSFGIDATEIVTEKSSTVVILNLLTNMVCPSLPVHLVLAPVFGGVRVAHVLLVLCVFSFISYVLLRYHEQSVSLENDM
jgi:hypothetical protein